MTIVVRNQIEVANRLEQLGWSVEQLLEVAGAMIAARNSCTENDPSSAPGWMAWKDGTRRLREIGLPMGLVRDETDQIPWVLDPVRGIKFAVSNTDDGTGLADRTPQNRSKKGPATERAVSGNQGQLFDDFAPSNVVPISRIGRQPGLIVAWYLCVYGEGDDVRAELSCPVASEAGYFTSFVERIFLIGGEPSDGGVKRRGDEDDGHEFEINVSRK